MFWVKVISWVFPFAASPSLGHGFEYEVNGFEGKMARSIRTHTPQRS